MGLALGDSFCAPYEGGWVERSLWKIIGSTKDGKRRFTDDTQMAMDVAHSLVANGGVNQDHLAQTFAQSYRWSRGYGPSASKLLQKIRAGQHWSQVNTLRHPQGSFGNGAAMQCAKNNHFQTSLILCGRSAAIRIRLRRWLGPFGEAIAGWKHLTPA